VRGLEQIPWLYDGVMSVLELFGLRSWRLWLVGGARGRTLDIGCGTGRDLPLYRTGADVVGVDPVHPGSLLSESFGDSVRGQKKRGTSRRLKSSSSKVHTGSPD